MGEDHCRLVGTTWAGVRCSGIPTCRVEDSLRRFEKKPVAVVSECLTEPNVLGNGCTVATDSLGVASEALPGLF